MNRLLLIATVAMLLLSACVANVSVPQATEKQEEYTGLVTKVAILPLKIMDGRCGNIRKILTVRDFYLVFSEYPQYELLNMAEVAEEYNAFRFLDVEDLELEEMAEVAEATNANVLIMGSISSLRADLFAISLRLYSARTQELKQFNFNVGNQREQRWEALRKNLMAEMDRFISNEVDRIFNVAQNFYAAGKYADAERQLLTTIGLDPENTEAYYTLGSTYFKMEKYSQAETNYLKVLQLNEKHGQTLFMLSELYEKTNEPLKRLAIMEKIATNNSDSELWLVIGNLYAERKDYTNAERSFDAALALDPDDIKIVTRKGFMLFDQEKYGDALEYLERSYDAFPDNELVSRRLAVSYQRSGRMDQAIARYEALIENNPNNTQAYLNVVSLYRNQASEANDPQVKKQYLDKAVTSMNKLISIAPDNPMAYLNLASINLLQGDNNKAEQNANKTISYDPTMYQAYIILATVSQSRGTVDYNRFVELEKKAADAVGKQATTLARDRDAARTSANNHFRRAAELLTNASSITSEIEVRSDINSRLSVINNLIAQTRGY